LMASLGLYRVRAFIQSVNPGLFGCDEYVYARG